MSTLCSRSERPPIEIDAVLERVARLTGSQSDAALAEELDTSRQVISGWRKRGTIPYEKLVEFTQSYEDVSLNYVLWGEEPETVEVPVEGNQVSAQILEVIGDTLLDAVQQVRKDGGKEYEKFMEGPQIFAYAALIYNRTIDQLAPGQMWTPAFEKEVAHIIAIVKLDFERRRASLSPGSNNANHDESQRKSATNAAGHAKSGATQTFHGSVGQVGGGDINNDFGDKDK